MRGYFSKGRGKTCFNKWFSCPCNKTELAAHSLLNKAVCIFFYSFIIRSDFYSARCKSCLQYSFHSVGLILSCLIPVEIFICSVCPSWLWYPSCSTVTELCPESSKVRPIIGGLSRWWKEQAVSQRFAIVGDISHMFRNPEVILNITALHLSSLLNKVNHVIRLLSLNRSAGT